MPLLHGAELPATRLCHAILNCGGIAGSKVSEPRKPAAAQSSGALEVMTPTRSITEQLAWVGVGPGVGVGTGAGVRVGVGAGVGVGFGVGFGVEPGLVGSGGSVASGPGPPPPGRFVPTGRGVSMLESLAVGSAVPSTDWPGTTTSWVGALVGAGASVSPATPCSNGGRNVPRRAAVATLETANASRPGSQRRIQAVGGVHAGIETLGSGTTVADRRGRADATPRIPIEGGATIEAAVGAVAAAATVAPPGAERVGASSGDAVALDVAVAPGTAALTPSTRADVHVQGSSRVL